MAKFYSKMAKAVDVAKYLIIRSMKDEYNDLTNLKLQKLCYYAQGVYSKLTNGKRLFEEEIEAWRHGPVIKKVYKEFLKQNGILKISEDYDNLNLTQKEKDAISDCYEFFSQYSAWKLSEMTRSEIPWKKHYEEGMNNVISFDDIRDFFDKALNVN